LYILAVDGYFGHERTEACRTDLELVRAPPDVGDRRAPGVELGDRQAIE
jgi:hypothetical protein